MNKINFQTAQPDFDNGTCKWYIEPYFNKYIKNQQDFNLPALTGLFCFAVKGQGIEDLVLLNSNQAILASYRYDFNGFDQMIAFINMLKISEYYDENEQL